MLKQKILKTKKTENAREIFSTRYNLLNQNKGQKFHKIPKMTGTKVAPLLHSSILSSSHEKNVVFEPVGAVGRAVGRGAAGPER
jgi:uncharacterized protein YbcI